MRRKDVASYVDLFYHVTPPRIFRVGIVHRLDARR
jgi:hypothetical protein